MAVAIVLLLSFFGVSLQPKSPDDLRKVLDNPISDTQVLSLSYQEDGHKNDDGFPTQEFNIEQKYYSHFDEWSLIHQMSLPIQGHNWIFGDDTIFGFGNFSYEGYFTPKHSGKIIWGIGPALQIPTATQPQRMTQQWSGGIALAALYQPSAFSLGATVTQLGSYTEAKPIAHVYIGDKLTIGFLDTITIDWIQSHGNQWTIPVGLQLSQLYKSGFTGSTNFKIGIFNNVVRPDGVTSWYWKVSADFVQ